MSSGILFYMYSGAGDLLLAKIFIYVLTGCKQRKLWGLGLSRLARALAVCLYMR